MIVIYDRNIFIESSFTIVIVFIIVVSSLMIVIYYCNMFIAQATVRNGQYHKTAIVNDDNMRHYNLEHHSIGIIYDRNCLLLWSHLQ